MSSIHEFIAWLRRVAEKSPPHQPKLNIGVALILDLLEDNESLREEIKTMRSFVDAVPILIDSNAKAIAAVGMLTDTNAQLTKDLATAQANAQTPEVLAAQQKVIDAAEMISPSTPPVAPPAV